MGICVCNILLLILLTANLFWVNNGGIRTVDQNGVMHETTKSATTVTISSTSSKTTTDTINGSITINSTITKEQQGTTEHVPVYTKIGQAYDVVPESKPPVEVTTRGTDPDSDTVNTPAETYLSWLLPFFAIIMLTLTIAFMFWARSRQFRAQYQDQVVTHENQRQASPFPPQRRKFSNPESGSSISIDTTRNSPISPQLQSNSHVSGDVPLRGELRTDHSVKLELTSETVTFDSDLLFNKRENSS